MKPLKVFIGSKLITTPPLTPDHYLQVRKESPIYHEPSIAQSNDRSLDELDKSLAPSINPSTALSMRSHDTVENAKLTETNMQLVKTLESMMKAMDSMEKRNGISRVI